MVRRLRPCADAGVLKRIDTALRLPGWGYLLQKAVGHASLTVTAHTYADLFDDQLDNIAAALDSLDDLNQDA
jgi:integrase